MSTNVGGPASLFTNLHPDDVARAFLDPFRDDPGAATSSEGVWTLGHGAFSVVDGLMLAALGRPRAAFPAEDDLYDETLDELESEGPLDVLGSLVDDLPGLVVACRTVSSFTSGLWGLGSFAIGERAFLYADAGSEEEYGYPLLAMIDTSVPAAWERGFRETYVEHWLTCGLPPYLGELASGNADQICGAIEEILRTRGPDPLARISGHLTTAHAYADPLAFLEWVSFEQLASEAVVGVDVVSEVLDSILARAVLADTDDRRRALVRIFWHSIEGRV